MTTWASVRVAPVRAARLAAACTEAAVVSLKSMAAMTCSMASVGPAAPSRTMGLARGREDQRRRHRFAQHALRGRAEEQARGAGLALRAKHDEAGVRIGGGFEHRDVRQADADLERRRTGQRRRRVGAGQRRERPPALVLNRVGFGGHRRGLHQQRFDDVEERQRGAALAVGARAAGERHGMPDELRRRWGKIHGAQHERGVRHYRSLIMNEPSRPRRTVRAAVRMMAQPVSPRVGPSRAWLAWVAATAIGACVGLGGYTFVYARGASYLTDDPAACANCHVMEEQFAGWSRASHAASRSATTATRRPSLVGKYTTKASNGFWHSFYFTTGGFPEPIRITPRNRAITEAACRKCHAEIVASHRSPRRGTTDRRRRCHGAVRASGPGHLERALPRIGEAPAMTRPPPHRLVVARGRASPRPPSAALLVNIFERKQEARNPFFRVVELDDETVDPAVWGKNFPLAVRRLPPHRRPGAHALRRQRGGAAHADRGRSALGGGAVAPRGGPAAEDDLGRLRLRKDFREERGHAYMLDDQTFTERQQRREAAGHLHALPRLGLRRRTGSSAAAT